MDRFLFGLQCEAWVAQYLECVLGWRILAERVRFKGGGRGFGGELDLVAKNGRGGLVFVEVKGRQSSAFGSPLEALTEAKVRRIHLTALAWKKREGLLNSKNEGSFLFCGVEMFNGSPVIDFLKFE